MEYYGEDARSRTTGDGRPVCGGPVAAGNRVAGLLLSLNPGNSPRMRRRQVDLSAACTFAGVKGTERSRAPVAL
jgi:hypothetical protein